jgi:hypothetical protein
MKASLILKRPIKQELFYTVRPSKVFLPSVFDHNHKYAGLHYLVMILYEVLSTLARWLSKRIGEA